MLPHTIKINFQMFPHTIKIEPNLEHTLRLWNAKLGYLDVSLWILLLYKYFAFLSIFFKTDKKSIKYVWGAGLTFIIHKGTLKIIILLISGKCLQNLLQNPSYGVKMRGTVYLTHWSQHKCCLSERLQSYISYKKSHNCYVWRKV